MGEPTVRGLQDSLRRRIQTSQGCALRAGGLPGNRARRLRAREAHKPREFERLLYAVLRADWQRGEIPRVGPCAIVGGVRHLAFTRVREHREHELEQLADEVLDWIESYRSTGDQISAARRDTGAAPAQTAASFLQRQDPQARILSATVRLTREFGYTNVTDSELARSARLPTQALHKQFPSKEDCFIAVIDAFTAETLGVQPDRKRPTSARGPRKSTTR